MPLHFYNPNLYTVYLTGPDGTTMAIGSGVAVHLPEFFERYCVKGLLSKVPADQQLILRQPAAKPSHGQIGPRGAHAQRRPLPEVQLHRVMSPQKPKLPPRPPPAPIPAQPVATPTKPVIQPVVTRTVGKRVVGSLIDANADKMLTGCLEKHSFPLSNNIGVGILSYNRPASLRRLMDSLTQFTDLRKTTVFISDDGSTNQELLQYLQELRTRTDLVVLPPGPRLGIAGNSNRLLQCLARFRYGITLNDDVEILRNGWDEFYPIAMQASGLHHFCRRQVGVYGAERGQPVYQGGVHCWHVSERPQGAVMAFTCDALQKVGFFDVGFGYYGFEHVDWSTRLGRSGLQPAGFYDVNGSENYLKIHPEESAVPERERLYVSAKQRFAEVNGTDRVYLPNSAYSELPAISFVVPCRGLGRIRALTSVVNNLRAQRLPVIQIVVAEQDCERRVDPAQLAPIDYTIVATDQGTPFNKAKAFNAGVALAKHPLLCLHDADILVPDDYAPRVVEKLRECDACHLGRAVIYATLAGTDQISDTQVVSNDVACDAVVGYFEGGSLACRRTAYWHAGGFNEDFVGYGCEDCEFYSRLLKVTGTQWQEDRIFNFLHLWHDRDVSWREQHARNKTLNDQLAQRSLDLTLREQKNQLQDRYGSFLDA